MCLGFSCFGPGGSIFVSVPNLGSFRNCFGTHVWFIGTPISFQLALKLKSLLNQTSGTNPSTAWPTKRAMFDLFSIVLELPRHRVMSIVYTVSVLWVYISVPWARNMASWRPGQARLLEAKMAALRGTQTSIWHLEIIFRATRKF